jgi:predicted transcriptional regulator
MAPHIPEQLQEIAAKVAQGQEPTTTVRIFLSWFWSAQRRGSFIKQVMREALAATKLRTIPDFDETYIDGTIKFVSATQESLPAKADGDTGEIKVSVQDSMVMVDSVSSKAKVDPSYRIARLKSAHTVPLSLGPDATIGEAITVMMKHEYSQLPVIVGERTVKGVISWKSLGKRLAMDKKCCLVRDAMESVHVIELDTSLFDAIPLIAKHDCVLVRDSNNKVCGIMTPFDVSQTFVELGEAFLLLGEIENLIRDMIDGRFSKGELEEARDPLDADRPLNDVSDLNFGGYVRLLQKPEAWEKLQTKLDRGIFVGYLEKVRIIRNNTMHFDPDGIEDTELQELREFARLLKQVKELHD